MSIRIGNIVLDSNVILAPISGVTDLPYRRLVKKFGAGLVVSEMIASRAMIAMSRQSLKKSGVILDDATGSCVQLAGCEPYVIAEAARIVEDMGAKIIDLNFGCPAKKVVGGYSGAALMKDLKLAEQILKATVESVKLPVTLKMRMGWDDNNLNAAEIAKIAEDRGIQMITVHGRSRAQFYSGTANWSFINKVKQAVNRIPIIANGDIKCIDSAKQALLLSGADGIMIGRGCYGKPWLISQISYQLRTGMEPKAISLETKLHTIIEHYDSMIDYYGEKLGVGIARKHLAWYSVGLSKSSEFRATINRVNSSSEVKRLIHDFFQTENNTRT